MKINKKHIIATVIVLIATFFVVLKLKANKEEFQSDIVFSQRKIDKIPVAVETVNIGLISENVVATGILEASEILSLVSETQGKIIKIYTRRNIKELWPWDTTLLFVLIQGKTGSACFILVP